MDSVIVSSEEVHWDSSPRRAQCGCYGLKHQSTHAQSQQLDPEKGSHSVRDVTDCNTYLQ